MLTLFFDCRGLVHYEVVTRSQMLNQEFYIALLRLLWKAVRKKRPEIWREHGWFIYHGDASIHTALSVKNLLTNTKPPAVQQPKCSTNLYQTVLSSNHKLIIRACGLLVRKGNTRKKCGKTKPNFLRSYMECWKNINVFRIFISVQEMTVCKQKCSVQFM
jgi:hypothetical protein